MSSRIPRGSPPVPNVTAESTSRQSSLVVGSSWYPSTWETRCATYKKEHAVVWGRRREDLVIDGEGIRLRF